MAQFTLKPNATFEIVVTLTETEARALYELSKFGEEEIVRVLAKHINPSMSDQYVGGLRSFFLSCKGWTGPTTISLHDQLKRVEEARRILGQK